MFNKSEGKKFGRKIIFLCLKTYAKNNQKFFKSDCAKNHSGVRSVQYLDQYLADFVIGPLN